MGVEPTRDSDYCPADGFEDREAHRDPSASMGCSWLAAPHDERPRIPILADSARLVQPSCLIRQSTGQPEGSVAPDGGTIMNAGDML